MSPSGSGRDADNDNGDERGHRERESFFQCLDRVPSGVHIEADCPSSDDKDDDDNDNDNYDDVRMSFATAVGDCLCEDQAGLDEEVVEEEEDVSKYDYGLWMAAEPMSIQERRHRLLQGMGLAGTKDLLGLRSRSGGKPPLNIPRCASRRQLQPRAATDTLTTVLVVAAPKPRPESAITRCRSDSNLAVASAKPLAFLRTYSAPHVRHGSGSPIDKARGDSTREAMPSAAENDGNGNGDGEGGVAAGGFKIKDLDNGKEFVISDPQMGLQLSIDEFERLLGYPPFVTHLMRRSHSQPVPAAATAQKGANPAGKKKGRWLKKIKLVASITALIHEKDRDGNGMSGLLSAVTMSRSASASATELASERLKVHHYGKSCKELTGLYMWQEVRAHEGAIWSIKFSADGRHLATGGEDRVVRVWPVVADASASSRAVAQAELSGSLGLVAQLSKKVRRGKSGKHVLPNHIVVPDTVFALAEKPACAFEGHLDDVLDLSWSKSQQLLSSSMDKTVRLWDMETKTCLKLFAHNDYVTCVQFNPVDDGYFISGSLDTKVRMWSVPERHVVDWSDLNDMVTAACYTPDGQGAIIGSHKGSCRFYNTTDCKLNQEAKIDINITKKRKSQAKKITGFQFAPGNPPELLVTSADSQIRVFDGAAIAQKFKGFKNTSSQISASYTADGRYVVCASEDSHVYVWKRAAAAAAAPGSPAAPGIGIGLKAKAWLTTRSYENFFCKDVSAAVPWPRSPSFPPDRVDSTRGGSMPASRAKSAPLTHSGQPHVSREPPPSLWHGSGADGGGAWGLVVVTASLGGEIRVYQNFGMPVRMRSQSTLFN